MVTSLRATNFKPRPPHTIVCWHCHSCSSLSLRYHRRNTNRYPFPTPHKTPHAPSYRCFSLQGGACGGHSGRVRHCSVVTVVSAYTQTALSEMLGEGGLLGESTAQQCGAAPIEPGPSRGGLGSSMCSLREETGVARGHLTIGLLSCEESHTLTQARYCRGGAEGLSPPSLLIGPAAGWGTGSPAGHFSLRINCRRSTHLYIPPAFKGTGVNCSTVFVLRNFLSSEYYSSDFPPPLQSWRCTSFSLTRVVGS